MSLIRVREARERGGSRQGEDAERVYLVNQKARAMTRYSATARRARRQSRRTLVKKEEE